MTENKNRREFSKIGAAAIAGMFAASTGAVTSQLAAAENQRSTTQFPPAPSSQQGLPPGLPPLPGNENPHACAGMNSCRGQGQGGNNACAFQGGCASERHNCAKEHSCKFTAGCRFDLFLKGKIPGQNKCSFKNFGETYCGVVPIKDPRVREIAKCYAKLRILQRYGNDARFARTMRALKLR